MAFHLPFTALRRILWGFCKNSRNQRFSLKIKYFAQKPTLAPLCIATTLGIINFNISCFQISQQILFEPYAICCLKINLISPTNSPPFDIPDHKRNSAFTCTDNSVSFTSKTWGKQFFENDHLCMKISIL